MVKERRTRPLIVPLFIPNLGCPHRCIFCHQETITARSSDSIHGANVRETLETAIASPGFDLSLEREVAFYGGTFTNLSPEKIAELLGATAPYLKRGLFGAIRVSTRPDALDRTRLEMMKELGVTAVELGVQSMDDGVLESSRRGHSSSDTIRSVQLLKALDFRVGIQLMPGLPGDSEEIFKETVRKVVELQPDMARLYPALVIKGTGLEKLYRRRQYTPLELGQAVKWCKENCMHLEAEGIPVIRIGLMSSPSLLEEGRIVAGPWHQAFGFLVRSGIHQEKIGEDLPNKGEAGAIVLRAPGREIPLVRGYRNEGLRLIEEKTGAKVKGVLADDALPSGRVAVDRVG